jgi:hypothetical protein
MRLILLFASFVFGTGGCLCTEAGCPAGVTLTVDATRSAATTEYVFTIETATQRQDIRCAVRGEPNQLADCTVEGRVGNALGPNVSIENRGVGTIRLFDRPESLTVTISADGETRATQITPVYDSHRPNGPYCPPECRTAEATVAL